MGSSFPTIELTHPYFVGDGKDYSQIHLYCEPSMQSGLLREGDILYTPGNQMLFIDKPPVIISDFFEDVLLLIVKIVDNNIGSMTLDSKLNKEPYLTRGFQVGGSVAVKNPLRTAVLKIK